MADQILSQLSEQLQALSIQMNQMRDQQQVQDQQHQQNIRQISEQVGVLQHQEGWQRLIITNAKDLPYCKIDAETAKRLIAEARAATGPC